MAAILHSVRHAAKPAGGGAPRMLVVSDCSSVVQAIESAWREGTAWLLHKRHRPSMLEEILLTRAKWMRDGGILVVLWVPSHRGVMPNSYADMVAKAYIGDAVHAEFVRPPVRLASLVQYSVLRSGGYSHMAAERKLLGLVQREMNGHVLAKLAEAGSSAITALAVHMPHLLDVHNWPWHSRWPTVAALADVP